ncbi:MAG: DUF6465 family protein [Butyrivibrio sp.]|nr:DUF6465 family protein [Butyrivibrio sp.]
MPETKKTEAAKPVASIKTPVATAKEAPKTEAKKPAVKKAAAPAAKKPAVKKAAAPAAKKTETKKVAAKKPAAKKPAAKNPTAKKPATKAATTEIKTNIVLQYADKNVTFDTLVENAENVCQYDMGKKLADIKKLDLYVKPEENTVYFVVNDKELGNYGL